MFHAHTIDTYGYCVIDILFVNAALSRNRPGRVQNGWLRVRSIYIVNNNNKTYSSNG